MRDIDTNFYECSFRMTEELKRICTSLQLAGVTKKIIVITSCISGEGKSTISMNLAYHLAQFNKKVLLIEGDMRNGHMSERFSIQEQVSNGLVHYLSGQCELQNATYALIFNEDTLKFDFIPSGNIEPPNAVELLASERMKQLLSTYREQYDYIIVDTPPLIVVSDAANVLAQADGCIIAIAAGMVSRKMIASVVEQIREIGCPIIGSVLNITQDNNLNKHYGYGYDYGYKKYGYGYYDYGYKKNTSSVEDTASDNTSQQNNNKPNNFSKFLRALKRQKK